MVSSAVQRHLVVCALANAAYQVRLARNKASLIHGQEQLEEDLLTFEQALLGLAEDVCPGHALHTRGANALVA